MELDTFSITELFFEPKKLLGSSIALGSGVEVEGFDTITEVFLVRFNNSFLRVSTLLSNTVLRAWLPTTEVSSLVRCNTDIVSSRWRMVLSVSVSASRVGLLFPFLSRLMQTWVAQHGSTGLGEAGIIFNFTWFCNCLQEDWTPQFVNVATLLLRVLNIKMFPADDKTESPMNYLFSWW